MDKQKLQLNFRPDDKFAKVAVAEKESKPGILLKLKCRKKKIRNKPEATANTNTEDRLQVVGCQVMGTTTINFVFNCK